MSDPLDPPSRPGMSRPYPPPAPARRQTDRYSAVGFLAVSLSTAMFAVVLVVVPEPHHWWHLVIAGVLVVPAGLALYAAAGIWRLVRAAHEPLPGRHAPDYLRRSRRLRDH